MKLEEINNIHDLLSGIGIGAAIAIIIGFIILKFFFPAYFSEKAKNLAKKEDIAEITRIVENVRSDISLTNDFQRKVLSQKQEFLLIFFDEITTFHYEKTGVNFGDFPNDRGQSLYNYQNSFYKSVSNILKSYQRLVVFLDTESDLLRTASFITNTILDSRKIMKDHFFNVKNTIISEYDAYTNENKEKYEQAVIDADNANSLFWDKMKPSVLEFRDHYSQFKIYLNDYLSQNISM